VKELGVIIFGLVWFLLKKVIKSKFFFLKKKPKPGQTDRFRFGFFREKPVQTDLARFFRFWLGFSGLARFFRFGSVFFLVFCRFRFGSVRFFRTGRFFQKFNRFNRFFFRFGFFGYFFSGFLDLIGFPVFLLTPR